MLFSNIAEFLPDDVIDWLSVCVAGLNREKLAIIASLSEVQPQVSKIPVAFLGMTADEISTYFVRAERELQIAATLALIASAEAQIRLDSKSRTSGHDYLAQRLRTLFNTAATDWSVSLYQGGICEAWKDYISICSFSDLDKERYRVKIGAFKNLLSVRHWVAHGRYWTPPPMLAQYPPVSVAKAIKDLFHALSDVANRSGIRKFG